MTQAIIKYGFMGCGMMGQEHIRNLALIPGSVIAAIVEPDEGMWAQAQRLAPSARRLSDLKQLLAADIDALVVCTPNYQHAGQLQEILSQRAWPVLIEKPLCTDDEDVARLRQLAQQVAAPVWVAMEYRYMPPIAQLRKALQAETLGSLKMLSIREHRYPFLHKVGNWNRFNCWSGGTLVEKCCHFFDLMRLLTGQEPVSVYATGGQAVNHLDEYYHGACSDILDHAFVTIEFTHGLRAQLELCMFAEGAKYQEQITLVGDRALIECNIPGPARFWDPARGAAPIANVHISPRQGLSESVDVPVDPQLLHAGDHNGSTYYQHLGFRDVVLGKGAVAVTLEDGLRAVEMGMAAQCSIATGEVQKIGVS